MAAAVSLYSSLVKKMSLKYICIEKSSLNSPTLEVAELKALDGEYDKFVEASVTGLTIF